MIKIRNFTSGDIEFALELVKIAGWNQVRQDIVRTLSLDPNGSFLAEIDGMEAGIATTTSFGRLGWIAFMIVHPDYRGKGLAKLLMTEAVDYLKGKGVLSVKLDATPMGFPVYEKMGFTEECRLARMEAKHNDGRAVFDACELPENIFEFKNSRELNDKIVRYDGRHFNYDRKEMIGTLLGEDAVKCFYCADGDVIKGYLTVRPGRVAWYAGPWVTDSAEIAESLLVRALGETSGRMVFIDVFRDNTACGKIVERYGFVFQRELIRMYLGENITTKSLEKIYGIFGPEKG